MRTSITMTMAAAALALIAAPGTGTAKTMHGKQSRSAQHAKGSANGTQQFVNDAAQGGTAEVSLGRLAADKASDPDVKRFAQRMVDDHSKANDELTNIASSKGIQPSTNPDAKQQALMDRLGKLSGPEFDKAYMQAMVTDHDHDVSEFQRYSRSGSDPEVKAWAAKTLPTLQEHQQLAKQTAATVGAGTQTGKSTTIRGSSHAAGSTGSTRKTAQQGSTGSGSSGAMNAR